MKNKEDYVKNSGRMGVTDYLFLMFVYLKLTDQIDWSWVVVTSPIWLQLVGVFVILIITGVALEVERWKRSK